MADIRILSETLSNKIAAGEVVARPASVVKELLENSIDARSSLITLEIENGGKTLIRVSDNGTGMAKDNALLSIERFATSKLLKDEDLFSISTMGFRGEAIPSIAAVSKFTLITRLKGDDSGTNMIISGGKLLTVTDTGAPIGTMVQVKNLFFNTPARKKFLKSNNTENAHIADTFSSIALGNQYIGFRLFQGGQLVKNFSSSESLRERVVKVLGNDTSKDLLKVDLNENNIKITGFVSSPKVTRSSSRMIKVFVNKRLVSDRSIVSALLNGYKGMLMKSRFPLAVLYISIPFDQVDINVHPAKNEVRFFDGKSVYNVVVKAVKSALEQEKEKFFNKSPAPEIPEMPGTHESHRTHETHEIHKAHKIHKPHGVHKTSIAPSVPVPDRPAQQRPEPVEVIEESLFKYAEPDFLSKPQAIPQAEVEVEVEAEVKAEAEIIPSEKRVREKSFFGGNISILGQVMSTYIIVETDYGLVLVDQHAAHERVVYEELKSRNKSSTTQSQTLLMPETLELNFSEAELLNQITGELSKYGFDIEPFGGTTFVVKSVPAIIDKKETAPFILEMIDSLMDKKTSTLKNRWLDDTLSLMACHSALRANQKLNIQEIAQLLKDLEKCKNPLHCPHGRPTMIKWEKKDMEKMFKRIV